MGFDRRHEGAGSDAHAAPSIHGAGKQTLVAAELEGAGASATPEPGKQTLVNRVVGGAGLQAKMHAAGAGDAGAPPASGGGAALPVDVRTRMQAALGASFA